MTSISTVRWRPISRRCRSNSRVRPTPNRRAVPLTRGPTREGNPEPLGVSNGAARRVGTPDPSAQCGSRRTWRQSWWKDWIPFNTLFRVMAGDMYALATLLKPRGNQLGKGNSSGQDIMPRTRLAALRSRSNPGPTHCAGTEELRRCRAYLKLAQWATRLLAMGHACSSAATYMTFTAGSFPSVTVLSGSSTTSRRA